MRDGGVVIAAVGDLHCRANDPASFQALFARINAEADILLLCGDLTDRGSPEEARVLAHALRATLQIPMIGVLGNHDFESGEVPQVTQILAEAGMTLLDGDTCEVHEIGFAGVKGFIGGFDARMLQPWGEATIKGVVHETVEEVLKLESALAKLRTETRVVLLHYAPIRETVEGEEPEIYAFLGSGRLAEPLAAFNVTAVFHGHAHAGRPEGRTRSGIPVYNVALPVLSRSYPERPPYRIVQFSCARGSEASLR